MSSRFFANHAAVPPGIGRFSPPCCSRRRLKSVACRDRRRSQSEGRDRRGDRFARFGGKGGFGVRQSTAVFRRWMLRFCRPCSRGFANLRGVGRAGAGLRTVGAARRRAEDTRGERVKATVAETFADPAGNRCVCANPGAPRAGSVHQCDMFARGFAARVESGDRRGPRHAGEGVVSCPDERGARRDRRPDGGRLRGARRSEPRSPAARAAQAALRAGADAGGPYPEGRLASERRTLGCPACATRSCRRR